MNDKKDLIVLIVNGVTFNSSQFRELHRINQIDYIDRFVKELLIFIDTFNLDDDKKWGLYNKLVLNYLTDTKKRAEQEFYFENLLIKVIKEQKFKLGDKKEYRELIKCLLQQEIDMSMTTYEAICSTPESLQEILAFEVSNPEVIKMVLNKFNQLGITSVYSFCEAHTDLCRMSIVAYDYEGALEYFSNPNYNLFLGVGNNDIAMIANYIDLHKTFVYMDEFNGVEDDLVYQILNQMSSRIAHFECLLDDNKPVLEQYNQAINFIKNIIYSDKIRLLNVDCLDFIKRVLNEEDYNRYLEYLKAKVDKGEITFFSFRGLNRTGDDYGNIVGYVSPNRVFDNINGNLLCADVDLNIPSGRIFEIIDNHSIHSVLARKKDASKPQ